MEYCLQHINWEDMNANSWLSILTIKDYENKLVLLCDKQGGWKLFDDREHEWGNIGWVRLLKDSPQFLDRCDANNGWSGFNGYDWQVLLSKQPQFAAKCDACNGWDVMSEKNWMRLISRQKQFTGKYKSRSTHKYSKYPELTIVDMAREFVKKENSRTRSVDDDWYDDYPDWREESGWNDMYGSGVDPSDIIEF